MDANTYQKYSGEGKKFVLIVSRFNEDITNKLKESCKNTLTTAGVRASDVKEITVPGVLEIPYVISCLNEKDYNGIIVLGAVIKGATPHFEYISQAVTGACVQLSINKKIPVSQGILTCFTLEQAIERSGSGPLNRGVEAAHVALEMSHLNA